MDIIEKGIYMAYQGSNGACVAMDEYAISRIPTGFLVESNNTIFGTNEFQQKAVLRTDFHWQMQDLQVTVELWGNRNVCIRQRGKSIFAAKATGSKC